MIGFSGSGLQSLGTRGQRGAIAILFGLTILVLFGFMALAIDLGRTYVVRTELQNAADAAALAGAKELNQTVAGVAKAVAFAKAMGAQNNFNFATPVTILDNRIWVGDCPDDGCMVPASSVTTKAAAADKTFLKVEIQSGGLTSFFAQVPTTPGGIGTPTTRTYGSAVAGRFVYDITPIGVCAIQNAAGASRPKAEALPGTNELAQFGFRRGVSYNIFQLGPLGGPSDTYLINPLDVYPNTCDPSNSSATATAPFVCSGSAAVVSKAPGIVYGNTGLSGGPIQAALNSRFNDFGGPSVCTPTTAPPDTNIQPYGCTGSKCANPVAKWMNPSQQTILPTGIPTATLPIPGGITDKNQYGVLWSYSRAVRAAGTSPNLEPGTEFAATDWPTLYPAPGGPPDNSKFPATGSPYLDATQSTPPTGNAGVADRRVLNLVIADCPVISGSGSCREIPVLGIGRFFMQVPADFTGSPKKLELEFAGLINPSPIAEIKLYR